MNNNNQQQEKSIVLNESDTVDSSEVKKSHGYDRSVVRNFSVMNLWSIRRNARTFRIHNRIPRL